MKQIWSLSILLVLLSACARQGVIPNPDKFPPHLVSVNAVNQTQINLRFDEALKPSLISASTFTLTPQQDEETIRFVAKDPNDSQGRSIVVLTSPLSAGTYTLSGLVADKTDNATTIKVKFRASEKRDTLPPYLALTPLDERVSFPYNFKLESAEPVDTSQVIKMLTTPFIPSSSLTRSWNSDLNTFDISCGDTLLKTQAFYLIILPGIIDFAGNRTGYGLSKLVYSDSTLTLYPVFGKILRAQGTGAASSLVLLKHSGNTIASTLADTSGSFFTKVSIRDSVEVEAYFDEGFDGIFEESSRIFFPLLPDTFEITTRPVNQPLYLEQLTNPSP